jgi:predicted nucleic acid-binding protein
MAQVYLETSFFGACVSTRHDARSRYWREVSNDWWRSQARKHELFISAEVVAELSVPDYPCREAALDMLRGLTMLEVTPEVLGLADILIREKVMPGPVAGDAVHLATATVHGMDYLLSWNVKHLANPNKRAHLATVCLRFGLMPPEVLTPDLLEEADNEQS